MKPVFFAIIAALILKLFVFDFIVAQGQSMEPSINDGTVLVVNRMRYGIQFPYLIRAKPGYLFRFSQPKVGDVVVFYTPLGDMAVKRCIALSGDGYFYAEGDNSLASYDSRSYGPVSVYNIIGKVLGY